jgi:hypothetical protein
MANLKKWKLKKKKTEAKNSLPKRPQVTERLRLGAIICSLTVQISSML